MNRFVFSVALATVAAGCVTRDETPLSKLGAGCVLNSDCEDPLVCVFRLCHQPCAEPRDCPAGSDCQLAGDPAQLVCSLNDCRNGPCPSGQLCGVDLHCRFACTSNAGCASGQVCIESQCEWEGLLTDAGLPPVAGTCRTDTECAADGGVCRAGRCGPECLSDRDCPLGASCSAGLCVGGTGPDGGSATPGACRTDTECAADGGVCRAGLCGPECLSDRDCALGASCSAGLCVAGPAPDGGSPSVCRYNSECAAPLICASFGPSAGTCVDQCLEDRDCQSLGSTALVCEAGACVRAPSDGGTPSGCSYNSQCAFNERCALGQCVPQCQVDRDCDFGFVCVDAQCVAPGSDAGPFTGCSYNSQCAANQRCSPQGVCIPECLADRDCDQNLGECCRANACVGGNACFVSADAGVIDGGFSADGGGQVGIGGACTASIQCLDTDFCNGAELCVNHRCVRGANPCDDGNPCTLDQCDSTSQQCAYQTVAIDADGDQHYPRACGGGADDCDDTNPFTYPGAIERCDGQDNNCDGQVDENLWHEVAGARTTISTGALWSPLPGPPGAARQGDRILVAAAGYLTDGQEDGWLLDPNTLSVISGPVAYSVSESPWQTCANNGVYNSRVTARVRVEANDAGFLMTALNTSFTHPQATCCQNDPRVTTAIATQVPPSGVPGTAWAMSSRSEPTSNCGATLLVQSQNVTRPKAAWDPLGGRWITTYWNRDANVQTFTLRFNTLELDGGVGLERTVYVGATAATKSNVSNGAQDGDAFVAVGTQGVLFAWTNDPALQYTNARFVRWVVYSPDLTTITAGPFATSVLDSSGNVASTMPGTRIESLRFVDGVYELVLSPTSIGFSNGLQELQLVTLSEQGQLLGRRYLGTSSAPPTSLDYGGGAHPTVERQGTGYLVGLQSGVNTSFRWYPRDADAGAPLAFDLFMGTAQNTRSDLALVPLDDTSAVVFWSEGDVWRTRITCQP